MSESPFIVSRYFLSFYNLLNKTMEGLFGGLLRGTFFLMCTFFCLSCTKVCQSVLGRGRELSSSGEGGASENVSGMRLLVQKG